MSDLAMLAKHRLANLTGFGVRNAPDSRASSRLVVYSDRQLAPFYVSEQVDAVAGNLDFAEIDLTNGHLAPSLARSQKIIIQVWQLLDQEAKSHLNGSNSSDDAEVSTEEHVASTESSDEKRQDSTTEDSTFTEESPEDTSLKQEQGLTTDTRDPVNTENLLFVQNGSISNEEQENQTSWALTYTEEISLNSLEYIDIQTLELPKTLHIVLRFDHTTYIKYVPQTKETASSSAPSIQSSRVASPTFRARINSQSRSSLAYDALVKIWTLQRSVDDSRLAILSASRQINKRFPGSFTELSARKEELLRIAEYTRKSCETVRKECAAARLRAEDLRRNSAKLHSHLIGSRDECERFASSHNKSQELLSASSKSSAKNSIADQIVVQQRRIANDLLEIFPIEPVESSFHFSIRGLMLPSVFAINHYDPVQVGAALGLVAQLVVMLSKYLDTPLPYQVQPYGSQSFIMDNISNIKGSRLFPLWTKGALLYRVEYALYLLHRDIERLMTAKQLPVVDLKQTLANLKNLLLVISTP